MDLEIDDNKQKDPTGPIVLELVETPLPKRWSVYVMKFMTALVTGALFYSAFSTDSFKKEQRQIAEERQLNSIKNRFVPEKTDKLFDSYVKSRWLF